MSGDKIKWLTISEEESPKQGTRKQESRMLRNFFPPVILLRTSLDHVATAMPHLTGKQEKMPAATQVK